MWYDLSQKSFCNNCLSELILSFFFKLTWCYRPTIGWFSTLLKVNMCRHASSSCTGYQFVTELPASSAPSCTTSIWESLHVIWLTLCSLPTYFLQSDALWPALSLSETDSYTLRTKFGERAFSSGAASWNSPLLNYAPSLTQAFLRTSENLSF